jgi:hypothetical protein
MHRVFALTLSVLVELRYVFFSGVVRLLLAIIQYFTCSRCSRCRVCRHRRACCSFFSAEKNALKSTARPKKQAFISDINFMTIYKIYQKNSAVKNATVHEVSRTAIVYSPPTRASSTGLMRSKFCLQLSATSCRSLHSTSLTSSEKLD